MRGTQRSQYDVRPRDKEQRGHPDESSGVPTDGQDAAFGNQVQHTRKLAPYGPVMRSLHLTLKREYFQAISAGSKPEEFRLCTPHWRKRLEGK